MYELGYMKVRKSVEIKCTYDFERSLNDNKMFSFKTKLIVISIFRTFEIYNFLLNIRYFLI